MCWWAGYAGTFCMFKITFPWASALKSWIKQSWIASSALEDLPEGLQGEAGRRQKDIPWLLQWLWNQTSMPKPEWMQQHYFMSHIQGLLRLCILMLWAFNPGNKWWQCSLCIQGQKKKVHWQKAVSPWKLIFYALHKFAGTLQIISEVVGVFFNFSYKDQHKNLASISLVWLTGNVTLAISSPELLKNISVPD